MSTDFQDLRETLASGIAKVQETLKDVAGIMGKMALMCGYVGLWVYIGLFLKALPVCMLMMVAMVYAYLGLYPLRSFDREVDAWARATGNDRMKALFGIMKQMAYLQSRAWFYASAFLLILILSFVILGQTENMKYWAGIYAVFGLVWLSCRFYFYTMEQAMIKSVRAKMNCLDRQVLAEMKGRLSGPYDPCYGYFKGEPQLFRLVDTLARTE
ncbi:MAG: hypothetical protein WCW17_00545 [Patescibacteria group bacterium]|jgi:hypothetical protein